MHHPKQSGRGSKSKHSGDARTLNPNIYALIIRIGLWGSLYYNYSKEPTI